MMRWARKKKLPGYLANGYKKVVDNDGPVIRGEGAQQEFLIEKPDAVEEAPEVEEVEETGEVEKAPKPKKGKPKKVE